MVSLRKNVCACAVAFGASIVLIGGISFVPARMAGAMSGAPRSGAAWGQMPAQSPEGHSMMAVLAFATTAGVVAGVMKKRPSKTARHYTTAKILPNMQYLSAGFGGNDLEQGEIRTVTLAGLDIAIGKTESGKLFAVGDKAPPTGISLSQGGYVEGECVVEPQYGSKFDVFMGGPTMIATFQCRDGGSIQVEVDTNARKAYEADYWKGLLDAQGKNDGTYY